MASDTSTTAWVPPPIPDLRVGMIGIGALGSKVALRLLWSKYPTLQVYDIVDMYTRQFTSNYGGMAVASPKMLSDSCDIVITALPTAREVRQVCLGWEALVKGFPNGGIVLDIGTTDPIETVAIGKELADHGVSLVDAPVFGTPQQAREGKLTIVVGGPDEAVERCRPILELLGSQVIRAGATGSAQAAATLADYFRAVELVAASEVFHLGSMVGLPAASLVEVAEALKGVKTSPLIRDFMAARSFDSGTVLGIVRKNVEQASTLAERLGQATPVLSAARLAYAEAEQHLGWGADIATLGRWLQLRTPPAQPPAAPAPETKPVAAAQA